MISNIGGECERSHTELQSICSIETTIKRLLKSFSTVYSFCPWTDAGQEEVQLKATVIQTQLLLSINEPENFFG